MSKTEYNNNETNNKCTKANDDKHIAEQTGDTKKQHKQAMKGEQEWHYNNNKRLISKENDQKTEKEKERKNVQRLCETVQLKLAWQLPKKQQHTVLEQKQHKVQLL